MVAINTTNKQSRESKLFSHEDVGATAPVHSHRKSDFAAVRQLQKKCKKENAFAARATAFVKKIRSQGGTRSPEL